MKQFLSKPLHIFIAVVLLFIALAAIIIGIKNVNDQASLKKANEAAELYGPIFSGYKKATNEELKVRSADINTEQAAKTFANIVDLKLKAIPDIEPAGQYGEEHSGMYKNLLTQKNELAKSYEELKAYTSGNLVVANTFAASIQGLLDMKVSDYLGGGAVMNGAPVRQNLIPPYQAALDTFKKVPVPKGQEELAKNTVKTYTDFINAANDAAAKLDAQQSFSFDFTNQFAALQNQLQAFKTNTQTDFAAAVQKATK